MKRITMMIMSLVMIVATIEAKTLIVYYSFTNNVRTVVNDLRSQLVEADVVEVEPAEEGLDYAANGYAIGQALISAIRENPNDAASYPAIKPVNVDLTKYDEVVVGTPLWWGSMAAPMQTFLFQNGSKMAGKRIGLIVSSASSGIGGVESDAKRLVPSGDFITPSLWIRSSQTPSCHSLIADWVAKTGIGLTSGINETEADGLDAVIDGCQIRANEDVDAIDVYDMTGNLLISVKGDRVVDISLLERGVYLVNIRKGKISKASKVRF